MERVDYVSTFIAVADDCPVTSAVVPPARTVAGRIFQQVSEAPYAHTSADVLFAAQGDGQSREQFFAAPRACLRASALGKRYGWGVHADEHGRIALVPLGTPEYDQLLTSGARVVKALRSRRA